MTTDGVAVARRLLDRFETSIAARDFAALDELCVDGVVLFGTSRANFGSEESRSYIRSVVEATMVRWLLDHWAVLHHDDLHLLVAADGRVETDDGTGRDRSAFRLTLWLVREQEEWRIKHFHGSVPEA